MPYRFSSRAAAFTTGALGAEIPVAAEPAESFDLLPIGRGVMTISSTAWTRATRSVGSGSRKGSPAGFAEDRRRLRPPAGLRPTRSLPSRRVDTEPADGDGVAGGVHVEVRAGRADVAEQASGEHDGGECPDPTADHEFTALPCGRRSLSQRQPVEMITESVSHRRAPIGDLGGGANLGSTDPGRRGARQEPDRGPERALRVGATRRSLRLRPRGRAGFRRPGDPDSRRAAPPSGCRRSCPASPAWPRGGTASCGRSRPESPGARPGC